MTQLEIHKKIEEFLKAGSESADVEVAQKLFINDDAKRYFFAQANEIWLDWLWKKGFLDAIKKKSEDPSKFSYHLPELEYLTRMGEKSPQKVAEIILDKRNAVKEENFNPEVINRFLWIIGSLPVEQVRILTSKIRDDRWVYLMRDFKESGHRFTGIIKKLVDKKDGQAILELAQSILSIKSKEEISNKGNVWGSDDPFYVDCIDESGIFEAIAEIEDPFSEEALKITTDIMAEIVNLAGPDDSGIFKKRDFFYLSDVDFFELGIENKQSLSHREDIKNLAATIKKLTERIIGGKCDNQGEAKQLLNDYIDKIPTCRSIWRLRLFALAQCPEVFKKEIENALLKIFDVGERYFEIEDGAEYYHLLDKCFNVLDVVNQKEYIKKVFDYFGNETIDKKMQEYRKNTGLKILNRVKNLLPEEIELAKQRLGMNPIEFKFTPMPSRTIYAGSITDRSPVNLNDYSIDDIVKNLKFEWTPEKIREKYKGDEFNRPRSAEGLANNLKEDLRRRTNDYLKKVTLFFDENIHPHYLYSLLWGFEEMLRDKQSFDVEQIGQILGLFQAIERAKEKISFERKDDRGSWLAGWTAVHKTMADILLLILSDKDAAKRENIHRIYREEAKNLISYLFTIKSSPLKDDEKPEYGEPYHVAINSVRGRAFEAFVVFTENDGKTLSADTKEIYKQVLNDDSIAVHFVIGRYLATFYFRDKDYIINLFPEIFPKDNPDKKDVYLATWEGYLSNTLYDKLFVALKGYYSHAIKLRSDDYTRRKYWKGLDESLAIHLALAFVYLGMEKEDALFIEFWNTKNIKRHKEFISFIGRSCVARNEDEEPDESKINRDKLIKFWNWALDNADPEALPGFGYWVNPDKEILSDDIIIEKLAETIEKSNGDIDWDYGFLKRLTIFAKKNGEKTFEIIKNYLLDSSDNLNKNRTVPFLHDQEIKESLSIIYNNSNEAIKQKVRDLINILIEKGSSMFWGLKEVIKN